MMAAVSSMPLSRPREPGAPSVLRADGRRARLLWFGAAFVLFAALTAYTFRALAGESLSRTTVLAPDAPDGRELRAWDQRYAVWAIVQNARAFASLSSPFDANQCFPAHHALALGHGVFALGALAVPVLPFTSDPVAVYDVVLVLVALLAPLAMYALVTDLTGLPLAGIVSGLVYGFHAMKVGDPDHVFLTDTAWFVLALLFLRRAFLAPGRLAPAVAFALATTAELAAGVYPAAASLFVGLFFLAALVVEHGWDTRLVRPALVAGAIVFLGALALYLPYFELARRGVLVARGRVFVPFRALLPGGPAFVGAVPVLLALAGVFTRRAGERPLARAWPLRAALAMGALVSTFLATGGVVFPPDAAVKLSDGSGRAFSIPLRPSRLYELVSSLLPGLNVGRGPAYAYGAVLVCVAVLAGFGCRVVVDAAIRRAGPRAWGGPLVALVVLGATLVTAVLGVPRLAPFQIRPKDSEIALFEKLSALGSRGPVLELPIPAGLAAGRMASESLLLSAYHRRRTSRCFASFVESALPGDVASAISELPADTAVATLAQVGFSTILVRRLEDPITAARLGAAVRPGGAVVRLLATPEIDVFAIR
ncbi:MAG TPA: hypothetical protein VHE30_18005 [Polyangiaceae bacterium]|nr:hypothetical protein [Polyangiaceae bacterium]